MNRYSAGSTLPQATVPCKWCEKPTHMTGTKECSNCHEIRIRLTINNMAIVVSMLTEVVKDYIGEDLK